MTCPMLMCCTFFRPYCNLNFKGIYLIELMMNDYHLPIMNPLFLRNMMFANLISLWQIPKLCMYFDILTFKKMGGNDIFYTILIIMEKIDNSTYKFFANDECIEDIKITSFVFFIKFRIEQRDAHHNSTSPSTIIINR